MSYPKCTMHTDEAINRHMKPEEIRIDSLPDAVVLVPTLQTFAAGGQQVTVPVMMPVCMECRINQLKPVSKSGLIT